MIGAGAQPQSWSVDRSTLDRFAGVSAGCITHRSLLRAAETAGRTAEASTARARPTASRKASIVAPAAVYNADKSLRSQDRGSAARAPHLCLPLRWLPRPQRRDALPFFSRPASNHMAVLQQTPNCVIAGRCLLPAVALGACGTMAATSAGQGRAGQGAGVCTREK